MCLSPPLYFVVLSRSGHAAQIITGAGSCVGAVTEALLGLWVQLGKMFPLQSSPSRRTEVRSKLEPECLVFL